MIFLLLYNLETVFADGVGYFRPVGIVACLADDAQDAGVDFLTVAVRSWWTLVMFPPHFAITAATSTSLPGWSSSSMFMSQ